MASWVFARESLPSLDSGFCSSSFHVISCLSPPTLITILGWQIRWWTILSTVGMKSVEVLEKVQLLKIHEFSMIWDLEIAILNLTSASSLSKDSLLSLNLVFLFSWGSFLESSSTSLSMLTSEKPKSVSWNRFLDSYQISFNRNLPDCYWRTVSWTTLLSNSSLCPSWIPDPRPFL